MKNIVLLERFNYGGENLTETILRDTDYNILLLCVGTEQEKNKYSNCPRIERIYCRDTGEIFNLENINELNYDAIEKYKALQSDFESGTGRDVTDYGVRKLLYYRVLSFWEGFFSNNDVDLLIVKGLVHGMADDIIPLGIAKHYGVPAFVIEECNSSKFAVFDYNVREFVPKKNREFIDMNKDKFYSFEVDNLPVVTLGKKEEVTIYKCIKKNIKNLLYKIGGQILIRIILDFREHKWTHLRMGMEGSKYSDIDSLMALIHLKKMNRKLNKIAKRPEYKEKYIVFFLHLEPEASVQVRCTLQTQLMAIRMISDALPAGWKLYVKEHPCQYMVNSKLMYYYLIEIKQFRTYKFYDAIDSLKNVMLVKPKENSRTLMKYSQAIATMTGTVALEATEMSKPVLLFGSEATIYKYCKDFCCIRSFDNLKKAIMKIEKGWIPDYSDCQEVCDKYLITNDEQGFKEAVLTIKDRVEIERL